MQKKIKKLTLHRETLCSLSDLGLAVGAVQTEVCANTDRTMCVTGCVSNCPAICNTSLATAC